MKKRLIKSAITARLITALLILAFVAVWVTVNILIPIDSLQGSDFRSGGLFPGSGSAAEGHLPDMTATEIMEQLQRKADESIFAFKINSRPVFSSGDSEGNLRIENPKHNTYPFVVKIFLNETSEEIYNSGGILPNHHIDTARLTKPLPKGTHAATAYVYAYDPGTNKYVGKAAVELTLLIKI